MHIRLAHLGQETAQAVAALSGAADYQRPRFQPQIHLRAVSQPGLLGERARNADRQAVAPSLHGSFHSHVSTMKIRIRQGKTASKNARKKLYVLGEGLGLPGNTTLGRRLE